MRIALSRVDKGGGSESTRDQGGFRNNVTQTEKEFVSMKEEK